MLVRIRPDLFSGVLFVLLGTIFLLSARHLPFGTAVRMGPGYFPTVLSVLLLVIGIVLVAKGLVSREEVETPVRLQGAAVLLATPMVFAFALEPLGLVPAVALTAFLAALGGRDFRLRPALFTAGALSVLSWAVFIHGLGLQLPSFGYWLGG